MKCEAVGISLLIITESVYIVRIHIILHGNSSKTTTLGDIDVAGGLRLANALLL